LAEVTKCLKLLEAGEGIRTLDPNPGKVCGGDTKPLICPLTML
jgi:hypothetical protein